MSIIKRILKRRAIRREKFRTGWMVSPRDMRDRLFSGGTPIEKEVSLLHLLPPEDNWLYQGPVGTCVVNAVANQLHAAIVSAGKNNPFVSRRYGHYYGRYRETNSAPTRIDGAYPRLVYDAFRRMGFPPERQWKYKTTKRALNKRPPYRVRTAGYRFKKFEYRWITGRDRPDDMRRALCRGLIPTFGTQATPELRAYRTGHSAPIGDPRGSKFLGGHYMAAIGYKGKHFLVANSWHRCELVWMDESWFTWGHTCDIAVVTI